MAWELDGGLKWNDRRAIHAHIGQKTKNHRISTAILWTRNVEDTPRVDHLVFMKAMTKRQIAKMEKIRASGLLII